jgi:hypothetical protein
MNNNMATTLTLLDQLGISNPRVKQLAELFAMQAASNGNETEDSQGQLERLREENEALLEQINALSERNAALAAAVGACPCWGEDDTCETCSGEGRPGAFLPDKACFIEFVLPVVRRLRQRAARRKHLKPAPESGESSASS